MRSAAGPADGEEALEAKLVCDRSHVLGTVADCASGASIRAPVPRARVRDVAEAPLRSGRYVHTEQHPRARRPGVEHHRAPVFRAGDLDLEPAAAGNGDLDPARAHPPTITPRRGRAPAEPNKE